MTTFQTRRESFGDGLVVRVDEAGSGRPILILHGGAGAQSVKGLAAALSHSAHVLLPTHPGFEGEPRPDWFDRIDDLALAYLDLLERLDLHNVLVIGSSVGGWIASQMAVYDTSRLGGLVLLNAAGVEVEGHPVADVSAITPNELLALSFHNPAAFRVDPATVTPEQAAIRANNIKTLYLYSQGSMADPRLLRRLRRVRIPALVLWGESDRVIDPAHGSAYAQALPNARYELISEAGHLPQLEQPRQVLNLVLQFANTTAHV